MRWSHSIAALAIVGAAQTADAQFTRLSPAGGALPAAVSDVGGIVADLIGLNGNRVVSQLAASTLFVGSPGAGAYPLLIGTQGGFSAATIAALGGGLQKASFRVTLFDGDNAAGNFDDHDNVFRVAGADIQNFSDVTTLRTTGTGTAIGSTSLGFADDQLWTGFFFTNNAAALNTIFGALAGGLEFRLHDVDPGDQFYDFAQGLDASVIDVGTGPIVTPPNTVPEPSTYVMMATGLIAVAGVARRRRSA